MSKTKYIAEGFEEDAHRLLGEFVELNTVEFLKFAELWRKHQFSLIFTGRPDENETSEFTNEVYRISMHFMTSTSFYQRVGVVYLLYAIYRNQIANPPVKIRIIHSDWLLVKSLHQECILQKFRTLHYVIEYLIKNAFVYVANQALKGPNTGSLPILSKGSLILNVLKNCYKSDALEYSQQNKLKELSDLHSEYLELKKSLDSDVKVTLKNDHEVYDNLIKELNELVHPFTNATNNRYESVGSRRAKIKAASFLRATKDRFGQEIEEEKFETDPHSSPEKSVAKNKGSRKPRKKQSERKIGRPPKSPKVEIQEAEKSDDDNIDISHLIDQQCTLYLPPEDEHKKGKNLKTSRYYSRNSPKRCSDSSDPES